MEAVSGVVDCAAVAEGRALYAAAAAAVTPYLDYVRGPVLVPGSWGVEQAPRSESQAS